MPKFTTYLLGAGASIHAIPAYIRMHEDSRTLTEDIDACIAYFIRREKEFTDGSIFDTHNNYSALESQITPLVKVLLDDYNWFINEVRNHNTVDTLAKKLFFLEDYPKLKVLKAILSMYFFIRQHSEDAHYDKRYDSLLATILKKRPSSPDDKDIVSKVMLPEDCKFISWNYDSQLEMVFGHYAGYTEKLQNISWKNMDYLLIQNDLKVFPRSNEDSDDIYSDDSNLPNVVKLNGTAFYALNEKSKLKYYSNNAGLNVDEELKSRERYLHYLQKYNLFRTFNHAMTFAWEENEIAQKSIEFAKKILSETRTLIIIGYSFPIFNREIDTQLLNSTHTTKNSVQKIIIQDPNGDSIMETILERSVSIRGRIQTQTPPLKIEVKPYTSQFIVP